MSRTSQETSSPHVLLFLCDQMQYQRQGVLDPHARTPELDRLAAEGVFFTHHHAANGQCVPSRASIQTGLYPHQAEVMIIYGFHGHSAHLTGDEPTVGQVFRDRGYTTAYFGKTHFGTSLASLGYDFGSEGPPPASQAEADGAGRSRRTMSMVDRAIVDDALAFIATHDPSQPLFLTVSLHQPHPPFEMVEAWADQFDPVDFPVPPSFIEDDLSTKPQFQQDHANDPRHGQQSETALREEMHRYYTMIAQVDAHFGEIRRALEQLGMWDETVVAFSSDHGDMMGAHRMRLKGTLAYDEIFRIPLVLRLPASAASPERRVVDDLSVNVALAGTLIEAAGFDLPPDFPGGSLLDSLYEDDPPASEEAFFEHYGAYWGLHPFRAIRVRDPHHGEWKYVKYYGPDEGEAELYDLLTDPGEVTNRAGDPGLAEWRAELDARVDDWWDCTGGQSFAYYESDAFRQRGAATLLARAPA